MQRAFAHLSWIQPIPRHFLHVWLVGLPIVDLAARLPLELDYRCVNCFHSAVVVQVRAPVLVRLHPEPTFLPHMTIGVTTQPHLPEPLRTAIRPLRDVGFGRQRASEAKRISFPAGRTTVLQPWTVVDVVPRPRAR